MCALSPLPSSGGPPLPPLPDQSDCSVPEQPRLTGDVVKSYLQEQEKNRYFVSSLPPPPHPLSLTVESLASFEATFSCWPCTTTGSGGWVLSRTFYSPSPSPCRTEASFSVVKVFMELYELVQPHLILPSPLW